jgi:hypothetical protein
VFHAAIATPEIDGQREVAAGHALKEQGASAHGGHGGIKVARAGTFQCGHATDAIGDLSDFKLWVHLRRHPVEFTGAFECRNKIAKSSVHAQDGRSVYDCRPDACDRSS